MATLARRDFRSIIYYNFARGLSKKRAFQKISKVFSEDCLSVRTVERGILTTASLEKSKTVTAKWYTETCLPQLFVNLVCHALLDSWFLHHDNAPAHWAFATQEFFVWWRGDRHLPGRMWLDIETNLRGMV